MITVHPICMKLFSISIQIVGGDHTSRRADARLVFAAAIVGQSFGGSSQYFAGSVFFSQQAGVGFRQDSKKLLKLFASV